MSKILPKYHRATQTAKKTLKMFEHEQVYHELHGKWFVDTPMTVGDHL